MITTLTTAIYLCAALAIDKPGQSADTGALVCIDVAIQAARHDVPPALAVATAWAESRMDHTAVGAVGELGPLQCNPNHHDCSDAVAGGLAVLARRLDEQGGDWQRASCRYTGDGPGCTRGRAAMARRLLREPVATPLPPPVAERQKSRTWARVVFVLRVVGIAASVGGAVVRRWLA